jgi:thioesterase domain-containing protein
MARRQEGEEPALGWGGLVAGEVRIIDLPGDHYSILRGDNAQRLADRFRELLGELPPTPGS